MSACRPSWCASGHRQPVRRTMNGAPSAVWSNTWPHGVERRSTGSSISSISFAAASRRPRRSCQRSSTRSDQDRPTPLPAGRPNCRGSGPAGSMQVYESIWTWFWACCWYGCPGSVGPARSTRPWWTAAARGGGTLGRWAARANRIERAAPGGGANPGPLAPAVSGPDADRFSTLTVTALVEILLRGPDLSMGTSAGPGCHRRPVRGVGSRRAPGRMRVPPPRLRH